jgi:mono/diheme cytochrome c family protein
MRIIHRSAFCLGVAVLAAGTARVPARQTADATKAAAGGKIHTRDCEACHSDSGRDAGVDASNNSPHNGEASRDAAIA